MELIIRHEILGIIESLRVKSVKYACVHACMYEYMYKCMNVCMNVCKKSQLD